MVSNALCGCRIHAKKCAEQKSQLQQQLQEAAKLQRENSQLQSNLAGLQSMKAKDDRKQQAENLAYDSNVPTADRKMQMLMNIRQLKDISALQVRA